RARRRPPGRRWGRTRPPKTTATPSSWRRRISRAGCTGVLSSRSLYSTRDAVAAASLPPLRLAVRSGGARRQPTTRANDVLGARARDAVCATLARALVSGGVLLLDRSAVRDRRAGSARETLKRSRGNVPRRSLSIWAR